ncbi:hypothetical protein C8R44DRAFT_228328 [Mycena epipterygia]|nr:hypothetical protein C8R44DRAFT_228328 [Mycena epipterygia]
MHSPPPSPAVVCCSSSSDLVLVGAQPPLPFSVDARGVLIFLRLGDLRYPSIAVASTFSLIAFISVVAPAPLLHPSSRSVIYFCLQVHTFARCSPPACASSPPVPSPGETAPGSPLPRPCGDGVRMGNGQAARGEERHGRDRGRAARSCGTRRGRGARIPWKRVSAPPALDRAARRRGEAVHIARAQERGSWRAAHSCSPRGGDRGDGRKSPYRRRRWWRAPAQASCGRDHEKKATRSVPAFAARLLPELRSRCPRALKKGTWAQVAGSDT